MALTKEAKQEIVAGHGRSDADTGSTEVQIALLSRRIEELTGRTGRIIIPAAACSSSSAGAVGCSTTCRRETWRATAS